MGSRLTPLGLIVKWVVAPVGLALVGYYVVGPRLGKTTQAPESTAPESQTAAPSQTDSPAVTEVKNDKPSGPPPVDDAVKTKPAAPNVEVTVRPANASPADPGSDASAATVATEAPPHHRRKRRRHVDVPQGDAQDADVPPQKTPPTVPPPDEGGSGGAATAGETTG